MTVLDTFYLIFKSNADDLKKGAKDAEKSVKELEERTKGAGEHAEKLGKNFVKLVESGASALGAAFSLGAIKTGVLNAADFNRQLSIQSQLMDVNTREMKAYAYAVEQAGGTVGGFQSAMQAAFGAATSAGLPMPGVETLMRRYHAAIRGMSPSGKANYLSQLGVTDPGMMRLLGSSDEEFERRISEGKEHAEVTREQAEAADEFGRAWSKAGQSMDQLFSIVSADVLPPVAKLVDGFSEFTAKIKENKVEVYGFLGGMIALSATLSAVLARAAFGMAGLGGAAAGAGLVAAGGAVAIGAGAAAGSIYWHKEIADWIDGKLHGKDDARLRSRWNRGGDHKDAMGFWMSQGYSREQAAVIVANEQAESGGNPRAVGDGGTSFGLFQWHDRSRRDRILKDTGIDVKTASADDQRRAAAWELEHTGIAARLKASGSISEASDIFVRDFENPANWRGQSLKRARMALDIASSSPYNSAPASAGNSTSSVKIDQINVQTQATDAAGISAAIGQELGNHLRTAMSNIDDGVAY